jgi:phosphopantetheinyl transferase
MPIIQHLKPDENTHLLLWHIIESAEELSLLVHNVADHQTQTPRHNLHWLASRAALAAHFGHDKHVEIKKDGYNKPAMVAHGENYHLSITHSGHFAAVLFSKVKKVAIDLEKIDDRVGRVAHKFINAAEAELLQQSNNLIFDQTLIWSAKETLYKFYGEKELDFKQHMTIFTNKPSQLRGCLHKDNPIFYNMYVSHLEEYIITYMVE